MADKRKLTKTTTPGVYRRTNADGTPGQYVAIYMAGGKQRREYADTLDAARRLKRDRESARDRGDWQERSTVTLLAYLAAWIVSYRGNGRTAFRESTRREYARLLENYARKHFPPDLRLVDVQPAHLARFVRWLADPTAQGRELSESTLRNIVIPVRAALGTARTDGLIRFNPADGLRFPKREAIREDDDEEVRALSREQLAALLAMAPPRHRLLVEFVAATGLRISEAVGLQRKHLMLDGSEPHVRIRRAISKGEIAPPKTRHGRRQVALAPGLVSKLRGHLLDHPEGDDALVFPSLNGTPQDGDNMRHRMLKPLMQEIGAPWRAGTRCGTRSRASRSRAAPTSCSYRARSGITRPRSRSAATRTCCPARERPRSTWTTRYGSTSGSTDPAKKVRSRVHSMASICSPKPRRRAKRATERSAR